MAKVPPNAILTQDQRDRLTTDEHDPALTDQARWAMYSRIRERLRAGIYDFHLIYNNWDELNLDKAFDRNKFDTAMGYKGVEGVFAMLYRGLFQGLVPFEPLLKKGIVRAEWAMHDRPVRITFSIEPEAMQDRNATTLADTAEQVNPDDIDNLRIDQMRLILELLAYADVEISELLNKGWRKRLDDKRVDPSNTASKD